MRLTIMLLFEDVAFRRFKIMGPFNSFEECNWEIDRLHERWEKWAKADFPEVHPNDVIQFYEDSEIFLLDEITGKEYWMEQDGKWYDNDGIGGDREWDLITGQMAKNSIGPTFVVFDKEFKELSRFYGCGTIENARELAEAEFGKEILIHQLN